MNVLLIITVTALLFSLGFVSSGAPWVPTKKKDVERFLKLAKIKPGQKMYDLGCGDGRLVFAAAQAGARAQGFERAPIPYIIAKIRRLFHKNKSRIKISYGSLDRSDLRDADLVYFYLMPKAYPELKRKFENELKSGAKVVAYAWPIEGWEPQKIDTARGCQKIYLYQRQ